jgi:stress response protein SCP2
MEVEVPSDAVIAARLEWDSASAVDVDLQAIIVDVDGRIIDAAYYNNMKACGKAVTHSGDEVGDRGRSREEVRVSLAQFPPKVHMLLFLACCFKGGDLRNAPGASVTFEDTKTKSRMSEVGLGVSSTGMVVSALVRRGNAWVLRTLSEEVRAKHFMDCLDVLNGHIVAEIPTANRRQKVAFAMDKGDVLDFGESAQTVLLGLGWDVDQGEVDLDASAVLLDRNGAVLECVFFGNLSTSREHSEPGAVVHSGDNLTGEGDGDDEAITVNVGSLGEVVHDVFFCIHMYSKGRGGRPKTFSCLSNP